MKVYVGNMSYDTTEGDLRLACEAFGKVESATIIKDKYSGRSKGFGFVEMPSEADGQAAIDGLNGKELNGRLLNVKEARPRTGNFGVSIGGYGGSRGGYNGSKKRGHDGSKGGYSGSKKRGHDSSKGGYGGSRGGYSGGKGGYGGGRRGRGR